MNNEDQLNNNIDPVLYRTIRSNQDSNTITLAANITLISILVGNLNILNTNPYNLLGKLLLCFAILAISLMITRMIFKGILYLENFFNKKKSLVKNETRNLIIKSVFYILGILFLTVNLLFVGYTFILISSMIMAYEHYKILSLKVNKKTPKVLLFFILLTTVGILSSAVFPKSSLDDLNVLPKFFNHTPMRYISFGCTILPLLIPTILSPVFQYIIYKRFNSVAKKKAQKISVSPTYYNPINWFASFVLVCPAALPIATNVVSNRHDTYTLKIINNYITPIALTLFVVVAAVWCLNRYKNPNKSYIVKKKLNIVEVNEDNISIKTDRNLVFPNNPIRTIDEEKSLSFVNDQSI